MIKKLLVLLACCTISVVHAQSTNETSVYRQELDQLKNSEQYKTLLNERMLTSMQHLQRNIYNYSALTPTQKVGHSLFLALDAIVVTQETMPALYAYIQKVCEAANVSMPIVLITRENMLFNAAAEKIFASAGGIIIGQKLMYSINDDALEAVLAHEIGHIKYNHSNKGAAVGFGCFLTVCASAFIATKYFMNKDLRVELMNATPNERFYTFLSTYLLSSIISSLLINKRFEKEADQFACKDMGKATGLTTFFTRIQEMEQEQDKEYEYTKTLLQQNKEALGQPTYINFMVAYYAAKCGHALGKGFSWLYHHTPLGAHPSHESRIKAAEEYIQVA